jgi:hypothetical protein
VDATLGSVASREQLSDLRGAEYTFDPGNKTVSARRWVGTSGTGLPYPIGEGVELLRIRYFDGTQWTDTFDTLAAGSLPVAIEVSIWQTRFGPALPGAGDAPMSAGEGMAPPPLAGDPDEPIRAPDRVRLIAVPDGPTSGWKGGA